MPYLERKLFRKRLYLNYEKESDKEFKLYYYKYFKPILEKYSVDYLSY